MRELERLEGRGRVSRGGDVLLPDVGYSILFFEREIDDGRGGSVRGGVRRMQARLHFGPMQGYPLMLEAHPFTLTLADGRTMNFRLRSTETGEIVRADGGDL